jgi:hypothetical protein
LFLGGGAWLGVPSELAPAFSIELSLRLPRSLHASVLLLGTTPVQHPVIYNGEPRGSLRSQSFAGLATFSLCASNRAMVCGGVLAGARVSSAAAAGPQTGPRLFATTTATELLPELGLYGRLSIPLVGRFYFSADLIAAVPLGQAAFEVDGISAARITTPPVDLAANLALGVRIY